MKKLYFFFALCMTLGMASAQYVTTGGPDAFGYSWITSESAYDTTWCVDCDSSVIVDSSIASYDTIWCFGCEITSIDTTLCTECGPLYDWDSIYCSSSCDTTGAGYNHFTLIYWDSTGGVVDTMFAIDSLYSDTIVSIDTTFSDTISSIDTNWNYDYKDTVVSVTGQPGPAFNWIDITTKGTQITGYGDDPGPGAMSQMGFDFPFYWYDVSQFYVGANGYIRFTNPLDVSSGQSDSPNNSFPEIPLNDITNDYNDWVAPMLCDLNPDPAGGGKIYYYTNNTDTLIVSYVDVPFWGSTTVDFQGSNTFQVILSAVDSSITFQYLTQQGKWGSSYDANENPIVIGIESKSGQSGLMVTDNALPNENLVIRFTRDRDPSFTITDIGLDYHKNDKNGATFGMVGSPTHVNVGISNYGDTDVNDPLTISTKIEKYEQGIRTSLNIFNNNDDLIISSMTAGEQINEYYTNGLVPVNEKHKGEPGTYLMTSELTFTDANASNNTVTSEFVILPDSSLDSLNLNYNDTTGEGIFGFDAGGIYYDLPFYPVTIKEIYMYCTTDGNDANGGFFLNIYAKNASGLVGDLLYSGLMSDTDINYDPDGVAFPPSVHKLDQEVIINDNGFFVSFERDPDVTTPNYFLLEDNTPPFSLRTFEVNGSTFGNYRSATSADIMVGAVVDASNATTGILKTSVEKGFEIGNAYPNPTNGTTTINISLSSSANVSFSLSNIIGQTVKSTDLGQVSKGSHKITFETNDIEPGVYFYSVKVGEKAISKKLIVK